MCGPYRTTLCAAALLLGGLMSVAAADHRSGYSGYYQRGAGFQSTTYRYGGYSSFPGGGYYNSYSFQYQYGGGFRVPYAGTPFIGRPYYSGYRQAGMRYSGPAPTTYSRYPLSPRIRTGGFRGIYSRRYYGR